MSIGSNVFAKGLFMKKSGVIVKNDDFAKKRDFTMDFEYGNVDVELIEDLLEKARAATIVER